MASVGVRDRESGASELILIRPIPPRHWLLGPTLAVCRTLALVSARRTARRRGVNRPSPRPAADRATVARARIAWRRADVCCRPRGHIGLGSPDFSWGPRGRLGRRTHRHLLRAQLSGEHLTIAKTAHPAVDLRTLWPWGDHHLQAARMDRCRCADRNRPDQHVFGARSGRAPRVGCHMTATFMREICAGCRTLVRSPSSAYGRTPGMSRMTQLV